jgi:hypothetical protein
MALFEKPDGLFEAVLGLRPEGPGLFVVLAAFSHG